MAARIVGENLDFIGQAIEERQVGAGGKAAGLAEQDDRRTGRSPVETVEIEAQALMPVDRDQFGALGGNGTEDRQPKSPVPICVRRNRARLR